MHAEHVLDFLKGEIRKFMNDYADNIATGSCQDFAEYKRMCGVIEGLALVEREILDLKDKLENS
jgi:hypothetical protein